MCLQCLTLWPAVVMNSIGWLHTTWRSTLCNFFLSALAINSIQWPLYSLIMWESSFNYVLHNLNTLVKSPLSRSLSLLDICYFRQRVFKKGKSTGRSSSANCYMPSNMQYINHARNLGFSLRLLDPCKDHTVRGGGKLRFKTDFDSAIFDSSFCWPGEGRSPVHSLTLGQECDVTLQHFRELWTWWISMSQIPK